MEATCKTCPFYLPHDGEREATGNCMRHAPRDAEEYDGVPFGAFPVVHGDVAWCGEHPARQRDRLAAMAMQGLMAAGWAQDSSAGDLADIAYSQADAMLAARGSR